MSNKNDNHTRKLISALLGQFSGQENTLTIPRAYIDLCDGEIMDALFLSQCVYWTDRATNPDGWFAKKYDDWHKELGLSEYKARQTTKRLEALGFLETTIRKFAGAPTVHYRVNVSNISMSILKKLQNGNLKNLRIDPAKTSGSYTETTTETTTDHSSTVGGKKARPRDVVFDAVVEHCFGTDPFNALEVQQLGGGRVGRVTKALRKAYAGVLDDQQLSDELGQFAEAWAETELAMPQHEDSLLPNFKKWRDANASTPIVKAAAPGMPRRVRGSCDDPACKGGYVKTAQGREYCRNCFEIPDKVTA